MNETQQANAVPAVPKIITDPKAPLRAGGGLAAIVPQDAEQAFRMAQLICTAGMAPRGMEKPEKIVTAIMHGLEIGLKPMQAVQSIAIVNGRPAVWGDAAIGLVRASGLCEYVKEWIEGEGDKAVAHCETMRRGEPEGIKRAFSIEDAKKAGLWGKSGPWQQYPFRMLQLRARAFCLRDAFADILKGLGIAEEVRDYPTYAGEGSHISAAQAVNQALQPPIPEAEQDEIVADPVGAGLPPTHQLATDILAELTAAQNPRQVEAVMKARAADIETLYAKDPEGAHHDVVSAAKEKGWVG